MFMITHTLFIIFLILSTIMVISSTSWFCMWLGLEINMMAFIPLLYNSNNNLSTESSIKYFLTQSFASMILMLSISLNMSKELYSINLSSTTMMLAIMIKVGAAPFHMWYPPIMEGIMWPQIMLLMTWQKIAPLFIISLNQMSFLIMFTSWLSAIIGPIMAFNQSSIRKIMAYSSITHLSWILISIKMMSMVWISYTLIYFLTSIIMILTFQYTKTYYLSQIYKISSMPLIFIFIINLLSMGGFPPLMGFMAKWMVLNEMIINNMIFTSLILILSSWTNLYIYLQIIHTPLHISSYSTKMINLPLKYNIMTSTLTILSLTSLPMTMMIF